VAPICAGIYRPLGAVRWRSVPVCKSKSGVSCPARTSHVAMTRARTPLVGLGGAGEPRCGSPAYVGALAASSAKLRAKNYAPHCPRDLTTFGLCRHRTRSEAHSVPAVRFAFGAAAVACLFAAIAGAGSLSRLLTTRAAKCPLPAALSDSRPVLGPAVNRHVRLGVP
jgi:hypothetical protein